MCSPHCLAWNHQKKIARVLTNEKVQENRGAAKVLFFKKKKVH